MNEIEEQWLTGFWEGDGTIRVNRQNPTKTFAYISFVQKDQEVLTRLKEFIDSGSIQEHPNGSKDTSYLLNTKDMRSEFLPECRSYPRRVQLAVSLASSGKLN